MTHKKLRKYLLILLLTTMVWTLTACGGDEDEVSEAPPPSPTTVPEQKAEATATPAPTATPSPVPTDTPQPEPTATEPVEEATEETTASSDTGAMPELPTPEDAQDVAYDADIMEIAYTSPSDVNTLVEFYRQAMPAAGWQEDSDFSIVTENLGSFEFSQGDDIIYFTLINDGVSGVTQAYVDLSEALSLTGVAADDDSSDSGETSSGSGYTINDWPVPAEAEQVNISGDDLKFVIAWKLPEIAEFYRSTFETMDLGTSCLDDVADYTSISCSSSNGEVSLNFFAFEGLDDQSEVEINFVNYALGASDSGSGDSLTLIDESGIPLPSDNTGYSSEGSEFSNIATTTSDTDAETILALYQTELPNMGLGWELSEANPPTLRFEGENGFLTVSVTAAGSGSEVKIVVKDPVAAEEAGIIPPAGQARVYLVNFSTEPLEVTINNQTIKLAPDEGTTSPADAPNVDVAPGTYQVTTKSASGSVTDEITVGADETWSLLLDPVGALPLQVY